ncbi:MAG: hypothetical protein PHD92_00710, partial [Eubacteriales bacterium]|nr:hypothetical protein [Eubacteriales bacterium]
MKGMLKRLLDKLQDFRQEPEYKIFQGIVIFLALLATVAVGILPAQYELEEGEISPDTIYASRSVIDQEATSIARSRAAEQVEDVYLYDSSVEGKVSNQVTGLLVYLLEVKDREAAAAEENQGENETDQETDEISRQELAAQLLESFPEVEDEGRALALLAIPRESV